jgi:hypothetical protein
MTFLEILQRVKLESGTEGAITSVNGLSGINAKLKQWTVDAWNGIQVEAPWGFMRERAAFNTVIGQQTYTSAQMNAPLFREADREFALITLPTGNQPLGFLPYTDFRAEYDYNTPLNVAPTYYTVTGTRSVKFNNIPDAIYPVYIDYFKKSTPLVNDLDAPILDDVDCLAIVYRAVMSYAMNDGATELYQSAQSMHAKSIAEIRSAWLGEITLQQNPLA